MASYRVLRRIERGEAAGVITVYFPKGYYTPTEAKNLDRSDLGLPLRETKEFKVNVRGFIELGAEEAEKLVLDRAIEPRTATEKAKIKEHSGRPHPLDRQIKETGVAMHMAR